MGVHLSRHRVKSLRGTFQQAKLAGLCLSSGWFKRYLLSESKDSFIPELMRLIISLSTSDFTRISLSDKTSEKAIEICLIRGFESGVRLGQLAAQQFKGHAMSTENLVLFLDNIHKQMQSKTYIVPVFKRVHCIQNCTRQRNRE